MGKKSVVASCTNTHVAELNSQYQKTNRIKSISIPETVRYLTFFNGPLSSRIKFFQNGEYPDGYRHTSLSLSSLSLSLSLSLSWHRAPLFGWYWKSLCFDARSFEIQVIWVWKGEGEPSGRSSIKMSLLHSIES